MAQAWDHACLSPASCSRSPDGKKRLCILELRDCQTQSIKYRGEERLLKLAGDSPTGNNQRRYSLAQK